MTLLFICTICGVFSTARGLKESQLSSGEKFYHSCNKVFCAWDYSLAQEKAAKYKHKNIFDEIKVHTIPNLRVIIIRNIFQQM